MKSKIYFLILLFWVISASFSIAQNPFAEKAPEKNQKTEKTKILVGEFFGSLEGCVTDCLTGEPIEGFIISIGLYSCTTGADGCYYFEEVMAGNLNYSYSGGGFCTYDTTVIINPNELTTLDIELCPAQFDIDPDTVNLSAFPGSTIYFYFNLSNPGVCDVSYSFSSDTDWLNQGVVTDGTLAAGEGSEISLPIFNISLLPGLYEGHVIFSSGTLTSPDTLVVFLEVLGYDAPVDLSVSYSCTDICLGWEIPPGSFPDYFNIYRNGMLIDSTISSEFCDTLLIPEFEYNYSITAVYNGEESQPSDVVFISIPIPGNLEPLNLMGYAHMPWEGDITIEWDSPTACISPESYNVYIDNELCAINWNTTEFIFSSLYGGIYEFYVEAVYYFGDTVPSNIITVLLCGMDEENKLFSILPNPVNEKLNIKSTNKILSMRIYDLQGQVVLYEETKQQNVQIDVSQFDPGVYFIKLEIEDKSVLRKIIVE